KHPHELLDSVVKERLVKIFRLNRGAEYTATSQLKPLKVYDFLQQNQLLNFQATSSCSLAGGE
ncbi:hypothetical protein QN410_02025, partial [Pseudomonas sp. Bout1]|uniref:hypothetical protein n=1 Tax=Pseudomonas sp. Bout1 TaxID=3048600 RepID=UPI002B22465C